MTSKTPKHTSEEPEETYEDASQDPMEDADVREDADAEDEDASKAVVTSKKSKKPAAAAKRAKAAPEGRKKGTAAATGEKKSKKAAAAVVAVKEVEEEEEEAGEDGDDDEEEKKTRRRKKSGAKALIDIRKYQSTGKSVTQRVPLERFIKYLANQLKEEFGHKEVMMSRRALDMLIDGIKQRLLNWFRACKKSIDMEDKNTVTYKHLFGVIGIAKCPL